MPDPNPQTDAGSPADGTPTADDSGPTDLDSDGESGSRGRPALLAATPGTDAVLHQLRTLALLAGLLALLVTLFAVELLVRL